MSNPKSKELLVDQVIGSAYQVVKYVAANMDILVELSTALPNLSVYLAEVRVAMPIMSSIHANMAALVNINSNLESLLESRGIQHGPSDGILRGSKDGSWVAIPVGEGDGGGDYTDRLRFSEPGGMINDVNLTEYESVSEGLYPICKTPLITDFTYNIATPTGSTPVLCWATTMEKVPTSSSPNWFGVWIAQSGKPSYNRRSLWLPYFGTDSYAASSSDLHALAADVVLPSDRSIDIYQKYLKDVVTSGTISISTDYVGGELYSDWDATSPLPG